ncbi:MAG: S-layer homology domain-containing protein [bacterium]|nr:S-layer homology domain-containing protein [bacterium]
MKSSRLVSASAAVAVFVVLVGIPSAFGQTAPDFEDVPDGHVAVSWMIDQGIARGCSSTMFCPDRSVTRQEFVTFLWRVAGRPAPDYLGSDAFADIKEDVYSDRAIGWAVSEGVTEGCTPGSSGEESRKFCPEQSVTRGQMAALLYRYTGTEYTGASSSYTDVEPDRYYTDGIAWLTDFDVVSGCGPGLYCPNRDATRAEAAVFIHGVATRPHIWGRGTPSSPPDPDPNAGSPNSDPPPPSQKPANAPPSDNQDPPDPDPHAGSPNPDPPPSPRPPRPTGPCSQRPTPRQPRPTGP